MSFFLKHGKLGVEYQTLDVIVGDNKIRGGNWTNKLLGNAPPFCNL